MRSLYALLGIYVVVISAYAAAGSLIAKRLPPKQLNRWLPLMRLGTVLLVCAFAIGLAVYVRLWFVVLPAAFGLLLFYPILRHVRVCESCGRVIEPVGWRPAASCPVCGASLRLPSPVNPARPPNNRWRGP